MLGIVTDDKLEQDEKAKLPIDVTLSGIITDVNFEQFEKAEFSIDVTLSGIVTDVKDVKVEFGLKAFSPIEVTG